MHQNLPLDDLNNVVIHLRPTHGGAQKDPNDPVVVRLLECAIELLAESYLDVTYQRPGKHVPSNDFMTPASTQATVKKYNRGQSSTETHNAALPNNLTVRNLHAYWNSASEFHDDVLNYLYRPGVYQVRMAELRQKLAVDLNKPFKEFIEEAAKSQLEQLDNNQLIRIQTALPILFPNHTKLRKLSEDTALEQHDTWVELQKRIMENYQVELLPGRTISDLQRALNVAVIGHLPRIKMTKELLQQSSGESLLVSMAQDIISAYSGVPWAELADRMPTNDIDLR